MGSSSSPPPSTPTAATPTGTSTTTTTTEPPAPAPTVVATVQTQAQTQAGSSISTTSTSSTSPKLQSPPLSSTQPLPPDVENEPQPQLEPEEIALPGSPKPGVADGSAQGGSGRAVSPPLPSSRPAPTVEDVDDEGEDGGNGQEEKKRVEKVLEKKQAEPEVKEPISSEVPVPVVNSTFLNQPSASSSALEASEGLNSIDTGMAEKEEKEKEKGVEKESVKEEKKEEEEEEGKGPFIRPYDSSIDFYDCLEICHKTASYSLLPLLSSPHASLISSIWCKPYLLFCPSTCFILDDGSEIHSSLPSILPLSPPTSPSQPPKTPRKPGKPIGYILGTPSTPQFIKTYKSDYLPLLDVHYPLPHPPQLLSELAKSNNEWLLETLFNPDKGMDLGKEFLAKWPGHFHIDILEGWRSVGWGKKLLGVWEGELKRVWGGRGWKSGGGQGVEGYHIGMDPANERGRKWYLRNGFVDVEKGELEEGRGEGARWMVKKLV